VPFQSTISSPFFNAVSEHYFITYLQSRFRRQWSHFSNKNSRLLQLWDSYKKEKMHAVLGYKKREKERTKEEEKKETTKKTGGETKTERGKTAKKHAEKRKNNRQPARISSPGRCHQHLHEAATEREDIVDRGNKRNKEKKQRRNNREEEERPQQHHRPTGHQHHRQLIYPSSLS
jgi:hypothetical protein